MSAAYKITKNDCIDILQKHFRTENFELLEFEEKSVTGEVVGIMSGHYKLKTKTKIENQIVENSFFVKRMQSQYSIQTKLIQAQGAYEKENFAYNYMRKLYEEEQENMCDYMVNCYLAIEDELFVFQDITQEGFSVNKCKGEVLDLNHLELVLDMTAKFHAGSIIYEHKKSKELLRSYHMPEDFAQYFKDPMFRKNEDYLGDQFYKTCVKAVLNLVDIVPYYENNKNEIKSKFLKQVDRVYDLVKPAKQFLNVVCHGDLWNSNLLFKYDKNDNPISCKIIDFQALRYTVPAHDFLYVIHGNSVVTDSKNNKKLSKYYYNSLAKYLEYNDIDLNTLMTYEQFLESIEYIYPFIIVQYACFANLCIARLNEDIPKSEKLFTKCLYDDRTDWCIEAYKNNELFKSIIDLAMKHLNKL